MATVNRNKFNARRVQVDGIFFDSKSEAARYHELKLMITAGRISDLSVHPRFPIHVNGIVVCHVELDFKYARPGPAVPEWHYEDVKSPATDTPLSKLKRRMVEAEYDIKVAVIMSGRRKSYEFQRVVEE